VKLNWFQMVTIGLGFVRKLMEWFMTAAADGQIDFAEMKQLGDILAETVEEVIGERLTIKVDLPGM